MKNKIILIALLCSVLSTLSVNAMADALTINLTVSNDTIDKTIKVHEGYLWRETRTLVPGASSTMTMWFTGVLTNMWISYYDYKSGQYKEIPGCAGDSWQLSSTSVLVKDKWDAKGELMPVPTCRVTVS